MSFFLLWIGLRFFRSWDLHGRYPNILEDEKVGEQARELWADAQVILDKILNEKLLKAKAIFGLFPANSNERDDIILDKDGEEFVFRTLRQQLKKSAGKEYFALSDFYSAAKHWETRLYRCFRSDGWFWYG